MQHYTIFFIAVNALHVFRRFPRPSSGAQNCTHSMWYMSSSKQAWHIPDAVCTVLSSWWWAEKSP